MDLIIVQQGAGLHHELHHSFHDTRLSHADRHAWAGLLDFIYVTGQIRLLLPVYHLQNHACYEMRNNVAGYFVHRQWVDLIKRDHETFSQLKQQHLAILPYIPYFTDTEMAQVFYGRFKKSTIQGYIKEVYGITGSHSKTELLSYMSSMNIQPVINKRNFPPIKSRPLFGG